MARFWRERAAPDWTLREATVVLLPVPTVTSAKEAVAPLRMVTEPWVSNAMERPLVRVREDPAPSTMREPGPKALRPTVIGAELVTWAPVWTVKVELPWRKLVAVRTWALCWARKDLPGAREKVPVPLTVM